jgi:hypothetical protein
MLTRPKLPTDELSRSSRRQNDDGRNSETFAILELRADRKLQEFANQCPAVASTPRRFTPGPASSVHSRRSTSPASCDS